MQTKPWWFKICQLNKIRRKDGGCIEALNSSCFFEGIAGWLEENHGKNHNFSSLKKISWAGSIMEKWSSLILITCPIWRRGCFWSGNRLGMYLTAMEVSFSCVKGGYYTPGNPTLIPNQCISSFKYGIILDINSLNFRGEWQCWNFKKTAARMETLWLWLPIQKSRARHHCPRTKLTMCHTLCRQGLEKTPRGGGFERFFAIFTPKNWGFMIEVDEHIFQMGGSTTN